ncbi:hypothetical protein LEN26_010648 [Aphanomyces euteiches]|nr:hypothetical protein LEN26_010648 [Aphanomyces euteiches]KAH9127742.1 hypothetical protein AeMF1_001999 [Aphanomyces euteiches]KAH9187870.1 hypothetical protein AeNC1_010156 [Aphanomyces euteiches]
MPNQRERKGLTTEEKRRVFDAYTHGNQDWKTVAKHNGVSLSTARRVILSNRAAVLPRSGSRQGLTKVTPAILPSLEGYLNTNSLFTLAQMQTFVAFDFDGVKLSLSTISQHLLGMAYTMKQVRIEPVTCNNEANKKKDKSLLKPSLVTSNKTTTSSTTMKPITICIVYDLKAAQKGNSSNCCPPSEQGPQFTSAVRCVYS